MNRLPPLSSLLAAGSLVLSSAVVPMTLAQAQAAATGGGGPQRVIVRFKTDSVVGKAQSLALKPRHPHQAKTLGDRLGVALEDGLAIDGRTQVIKASALGAAALAARLAAQPDVEYAEVDERAYALAAPNDPRYANGSPVAPAAGQWYLRPPTSTLVSAIDAESAWDITTGDPDVVVAVLDTGVRFNHPDLAGQLLAGYDFVSDVPTANDGNARDSDPSDPGSWVSSSDLLLSDFDGCTREDSNWHGTQVSGLIAALTGNGVGMASVGRQVKVLPVRVLGKCGGFVSDIQAGMRWAAGLSVPGVADNPTPARVLNLSLGTESATCSSAYQSAVDAVRAAGVVVVAAAGNSGSAAGSPANCSGVIGVAGLRHSGTKVSYSSLGSTVSIAAPAGNCVNASGTCEYPLLTTSNSGTTTPASNIYTGGGDNATLGTSFASPLVAGTVGLMLSVRPSLGPNAIASILKSSATAFPTSGGSAGIAACQSTAAAPSQDLECYCTTSTCGAGMLNAKAAVQQARDLTVDATAVIRVSPASPTEGDTITLDGRQSTGGGDATVRRYAWSITSGEAIATLSNGSAAIATISTSGSGIFSVRLTITDSAGAQASTTKSITVQADDVGNGDNNSSSGGAASALWLGLLGLSVGVLGAERRRRPARR